MAGVSAVPRVARSSLRDGEVIPLPQPMEPEDERAKLQREFVQAQKAMAQLAARMERAGMLRAA